MARMRSPSPADGFPLGHSATSPQPLLSKRDKRRNQLADKLNEMMAQVSDNRDSHYRAQMSALQGDINLILKANPYANKPLDDSGDEAKELITQVMGNATPTAPSAGTDYIAQVGKHYARFVDAANDALEERDYNLSQLWAKNENTKTEIENTYLYKAKIAEEEHKLLAATIRERLMASIQQRTNKLKREKEQLDLSDSNAMLLHPNQFSINNPGSPGGTQAPRKTRRTGHKFGDAEDIATTEKRKRKFYEDNEIGSPGPAGRNVELGVGSPFREAKQRTMNTQFEASAYSLDRLFTEKELNMALNQATTAASNFFAKMKDAENTQDNPPNNTNGTIPSENDADGPDAAGSEGDSPPNGADMARTASANPHATRGQTRSQFYQASLAEGKLPFIYNPPFVLDAKIFQKPNAQAPTPPPLSAQDVDQDLRLMFRDAPPEDALNEKLLQAAVKPMKAREYMIQPPGFEPPVDEMVSQVRATAPHLEAGLGVGGVPMSAQSSVGGYSETGRNTPITGFGGVEGIGGVGMARSASNPANATGRRGGRRGA